jgi:hypothetical protein
VDGDYVHAGTGFTYPASIEGYTRGRIYQFDANALDVSAGYDSADPTKPLAITVYVYPAPKLDTGELTPEEADKAREMMAGRWYRAEKREILSGRKASSVVQEKQYALERDGLTFTAEWTVFEFTDRFGKTQQPIRSHLFLFRYVGDEWAIKFRMTHPKSFDATSEIESFLSKLPWTLADVVAFQPEFERR